MKIIRRLLAMIVVIVLVVIVTVWWRYGGGGHFPDRTGTPELPDDALQLVANLDKPPGNIAVSASGRIFFSFHPEGRPAINVAELVDGQPVAFPPNLPEELQFQSVLSLRIDRQDHLWVLD